MRYFIVFKDDTAAYTDWYDYENLYNPDTIICVVDIATDRITFNGCDWKDIEEDHL